MLNYEIVGSEINSVFRQTETFRPTSGTGCTTRQRMGKKHATVDYAFKYDPAYLVAYHCLVMDEMIRRGYNPDKTWYKKQWRGTTLGEVENWCDEELCRRLYDNAVDGSVIYPEHNDNYLAECIALLKEKEAPIDWEMVERELGVN